jgi:hypothetical protein
MPRSALSNLAYEYVRLFNKQMERARKRSLFWRIGKPCTTEGWQEFVFQLLLKENIRSLKARYGNRLWDQYEKASTWTFQPPTEAYTKLPLDGNWLINSCDCYDYQACETSDYHRTTAAKIIRSLRDAGLKHLPRPELPIEAWGGPLPEYDEERQI